MQQLRIDTRDFNDTNTYAAYSTFRILSEKENYQLHVGSYLGGNMGELHKEFCLGVFASRRYKSIKLALLEILKHDMKW